MHNSVTTQQQNDTPVQADTDSCYVNVWNDMFSINMHDIPRAAFDKIIAKEEHFGLDRTTREFWVKNLSYRRTDGEPGQTVYMSFFTTEPPVLPEPPRAEFENDWHRNDEHVETPYEDDFQHRSDAAKKGWVTRRHNAEAMKHFYANRPYPVYPHPSFPEADSNGQ